MSELQTTRHYWRTIYNIHSFVNADHFLLLETYHRPHAIYWRLLLLLANSGRFGSNDGIWSCFLLIPSTTTLRKRPRTAPPSRILPRITSWLGPFNDTPTENWIHQLRKSSILEIVQSNQRAIISPCRSVSFRPAFVDLDRANIAYSSLQDWSIKMPPKRSIVQ